MYREQEGVTVNSNVRANVVWSLCQENQMMMSRPERKTASSNRLG